MQHKKTENVSSDANITIQIFGFVRAFRGVSDASP
jgi:hypothetical protein